MQVDAFDTSAPDLLLVGGGLANGLLALRLSQLRPDLDVRIVEAAQTLGATRGEVVRLVILPSAKPALLDTMRVTMGWAWTYLVVAELVAANSGLGYAILKAQRFLQTDKIFAGIILIGLIGLVTDQMFRLWHRKAFPWMHLK
jgi:NitT/TauT family transport system permease protein